jgi:hypothetical protein
MGDFLDVMVESVACFRLPRSLVVEEAIGSTLKNLDV